MISVCIITKNERENLKECLERLVPYGFEIVVVDTGSTDDSKEVALQYTEHVYDFEWCNDFSAARNFAISKASNEYILVLDTDEFVEKLDKNKLLRLIKENPDKVGRIHINNTYFVNGKETHSNEYVTRLFSKNLYGFKGRIHEQVVLLENTEAVTPLYVAPVYILHNGYQGVEEERRRKAKRNLDLLLLDLQENGDDPYTLYQIGKGYYYMQEYEKSIPYFERAMEFQLDMRLEYVVSMVVTYGYALLNAKQVQKALMLEALYEDYGKNADFLFVLALIYMQNAKFDLAIETFLKATKIDKCEVEGVNSWSAFYNIGVIYECLGNTKAACNYYRKCGSYEPAKQGLKRCLGK